MWLTRPNAFALTLAVGFLLPSVIPGLGLDYPYFFIIVIVLLAWFMIKWDSVKAIPFKSRTAEQAAGLLVIGGDYVANALRGSSVGLIDLLVVFLASVLLAFGVRALRSFWVPVAYGAVLLAGYQIEAVLPNYVALQDWLAGVMTGAMNALGIGAAVAGHQVTMTLSDGTAVLLDVSSDCTGLQGILAFGMLSTMALLDTKPRLSRIVPLLAVGFIGAFLINIVRLIVVFLTFEFLGIDAGTTVHVYFGYLIFIVWVMAFWMIAFRYLGPPRGSLPSEPAMAPPSTTLTSP